MSIMLCSVLCLCSFNKINDVLCSSNAKSMNSPRMICCCSSAGTGTGKCCAVVAYCWVGSCCTLLKAAVQWQNVVPLGGLVGTVMAGLAGAGVVAVAGAGLGEYADIRNCWL